MNRHQTRKQIRQQLAAVSAELEAIKRPEGLADYLFSKRDDEAFQEAVRERMYTLRETEANQVEEAPDAEEAPATEPPPADSDLAVLSENQPQLP